MSVVNSQDDRLKSEGRTSNRSKITGVVLVGTLLAAHLVCNLWWLRVDNQPQVGDPAVHLTEAHRYYRVLTNPYEPSFVKRVAAMRAVPLGWYPPVVHVLGAFSAYVFGDTKASYALVNSLTFLLIVVSSYGLARFFFSRGVSVYAAAVVGFVPFLYGMSRLFLLDLLSALIVVLVYIALIKSGGFQRLRWVVAIGLLTAFGFWVRWTTPLYYALPLGGVFLASVLGRKPAAEDETGRDRSRALIGVTAIAGIAILGVGAWLIRSGVDPREVYERSYAPIQGDMGLWRWQTWVAYPMLIVNTGVFLPTAVLALAGICVAAVGRRKHAPTLILLGWLLGTIVVLTLLIPLRIPAPRYIVPALVPVAIFAVMAVDALPGRWLRNTAMALFMALLAAQYVNITFAPTERFDRLAFDVPRSLEWPRHVKDQNLVVYERYVDGSGAKYGPPYRGANWLDKALGAMAEADLSPHPIANQDARYALIGTRRSAVAGKQREFWPVRNPFRAEHEMRRVPGHYVDLAAGAPLHIQAVEPDGSGSTRMRLPMSDDLRLPVPSALHIAGEGPFDFAGISFELAANSGELRAYSVETLEGDGNGVENLAVVTNNTKRFMFHATEEREVSAVAIHFTGSGEREEVILRDVSVYTRIPQPRPLILSHYRVRERLRGMPPEVLEPTEYALWIRTKGGFPRAALENFPGFERLLSFDANLFGHWGPRTFHVLRKPPRPVITFETCPELEVTVSGDAFPDGRWDLPWWRFNWWTAVSNPELMKYWSAPTPATMEASFPDAYRIDGIELVPYAREMGMPPVQVSYQATPDGAWSTLPAASIAISDPLFADRERVLYNHEYPPEWSDPIVARKLRFEFMPGDRERVHLANIFVYGSPID